MARAGINPTSVNKVRSVFVAMNRRADGAP
jgi:hypothetical protein